MIHWFMNRKRRNALLLGVPVMALVFVLLATIGLTQSTEQAESSDNSKNYEEVFFSAIDTNYPDIIYIDWSALKAAAHESSCAEWFLGAYRFTDGSLCVDLERNILTNNLYYALNCSVGDNSTLYLNLRDTNGVLLAESGNLLAVTNAIWYADGTNTILLFDVPTAKYPSAAVLQLTCHSRPPASLPSPQSLRASVAGGCEALRADGSGNPVQSKLNSDNDSAIIHESLLFINDGSGLWLSEGQGNVATNYSNNSLSNFYDWVKENSSTNSPGGGGGGGGNDDPGEDDNRQGKKGIIYVDQATGNDTFTGRAPAISANKKGPKKTVRGGLSIAGTNDTIIIRPGNYNENLNIQGKDVKVFIEGKVRL